MNIHRGVISINYACTLTCTVIVAEEIPVEFDPNSFFSTTTPVDSSEEWIDDPVPPALNRTMPERRRDPMIKGNE